MHSVLYRLISAIEQLRGELHKSEVLLITTTLFEVKPKNKCVCIYIYIYAQYIYIYAQYIYIYMPNIYIYMPNI